MDFCVIEMGNGVLKNPFSLAQNIAKQLSNEIGSLEHAYFRIGTAKSCQRTSAIAKRKSKRVFCSCEGLDYPFCSNLPEQ